MFTGGHNNLIVGLGVLSLVVLFIYMPPWLYSGLPIEARKVEAPLVKGAPPARPIASPICTEPKVSDPLPVAASIGEDKPFWLQALSFKQRVSMREHSPSLCSQTLSAMASAVKEIRIPVGF
jgi:hypothetical protein